jgi:hypothetical protein
VHATISSPLDCGENRTLNPVISERVDAVRSTAVLVYLCARASLLTTVRVAGD